jgi:predicted RNase H-like HicB family nuclease
MVAGWQTSRDFPGCSVSGLSMAEARARLVEAFELFEELRW